MSADDRPTVWIHPPALVMAAVVVGYLVRLAYGGMLPLPRAAGEGIGVALVLAGLVGLVQSVRFFIEHGETLRPETPSHSLLRGGPFARSRNPIYAAMMLVGVGLGFATLNAFIIATTLFAGLVLHFLVILPEENYLERRFGPEYLAYKKEVRRWI